MPKSKKIESNKNVVKEKEVEEKEILLDDEDKVIDADISIGDTLIPDEDEDEDGLLDDDEVDPFKDKWEE